MSAETFQTILGSFVETVKIIAIIVVLMVVIKFSELKYKNKIREKITAELYELEKKNK